MLHIDLIIFKTQHNNNISKPYRCWYTNIYKVSPPSIILMFNKYRISPEYGTLRILFTPSYVNNKLYINIAAKTKHHHDHIKTYIGT